MQTGYRIRTDLALETQERFQEEKSRGAGRGGSGIL